MPISTSLESVLRRMVWDRFRPGTDLRGGTAIGTLHSSPSGATAILNCMNRDNTYDLTHSLKHYQRKKFSPHYKCLQHVQMPRSIHTVVVFYLPNFLICDMDNACDVYYSTEWEF